MGRQFGRQGTNVRLMSTMAKWSIRILGPFRAERDGVEFRPRTQLQAQLIARLCAHHPEPIMRGETAQLLWPEAGRPRALTYLRRAIMELRQADFPLTTRDDLLLLDPELVSCDLFAMREGEGAGAEETAVLEDFSGAVAEEVRLIAASLFGNSSGKGDASRDIFVQFGRYAAGAQPALAAEFLEARPELFAAGGAQDAILDLARLVASSPQPLAHSSVRMLLRAARIARVRTRYRLAEQWLGAAISAARECGWNGELAELYGEYSFLEMERRNWNGARAAGELAVETALAHKNPATLAAACDSFGRIQWQLQDYERAADNYLQAHRLSSDRGRRIAILANLTYIWGVLGVQIDLPEPESIEDTDGYYERGADNYRQFALFFGRGETIPAARAAALNVEMTARNDMERFFCVALDCAVLSLAGLGRRAEAAACLRAGTRMRNQIGHRRAPMERDSLRRHVKGPFFGPDVESVLRKLQSDDPVVLAARVARRLRARG